MLWMQTFVNQPGDYQVKLALRLQNMAASKAGKRKVQSRFDAFDAWPPILSWKFKPIANRLRAIGFSNRRSAPAAFGRSGQPGAEKETLRVWGVWSVWLRDRYARWGTGRYKSCVETKGMLKCLSKNGKEMERTGIWKIRQQNSRFIVVCRNMREFGSAKCCRKQPWYWHQFLWCNKHSNI